ncbi:hypothetical protein GGTG_13287 [Gaeumannomyces tritici R3-111a-1]|uniref:Uncharacterized protein n=1 Tax=Gaeumannomyces tritici (strain R3-111a-1) TaxID=644352 RepID=J3PIF9_GAET3|nr:hypothetical protein GGTG_13287 [Gaeumannomyces tritici R3-111a-1]EJT69178.1 hypothetical protein GGTG_13287 [Gaeumannomyces tritici R3-111a-1]
MARDMRVCAHAWVRTSSTNVRKYGLHGKYLRRCNERERESIFNVTANKLSPKARKSGRIPALLNSRAFTVTLANKAATKPCAYDATYILI